MSTNVKKGIGDLVQELAESYGKRMSDTEFATTLSNSKLSVERYRSYIISTYPLVVAFNRGMATSFAKIDPGIDHQLLKGLSKQLIEELAHNDLWRRKLTTFGVDYNRAYKTFKSEVDAIVVDEKNKRRSELIEELRKEPDNVLPSLFPNLSFPEPVYGLYLQAEWTGSDSSVGHSTHFACQLAIEIAVFEVVSESVLPGVRNSPELSPNSESLAWWREHARATEDDPSRGAAEQRHQQLALEKLNDMNFDENERASLLKIVEDTMILLVATMKCHDSKYGFTSFEEFVG